MEEKYSSEDTENNCNKNDNECNKNENICNKNNNKEKILDKDNQYIVHLINIKTEKSENIVQYLGKVKINTEKIKIIKELKYYIIDTADKNLKLCPCLLTILIPFEDDYCYSEANDYPNKLIKECFPNEKNIYINLNLDDKCYCGFNKLESLTKREIYEMYMEKINKLNKYSDIKENEKDHEIKEYEDINKEILVSFDKEIKRKQMESKIYAKIKSNFNLKNSVLNFYDVIIDIKSIKDINKGWEIKMNEIGEKRFIEHKKKNALIIGIIGNSNKGKSFLLSKISKIDLPSGTNISTEGLSIKYPELEEFKNRKIVLLDSAGLESPVLLNDYEKNKILNNENIKENTNELNKLLKEKAREKLLTELFLQNFIIYNSNILIVVIGILTYTEQKLLNRIKEEISKTKLKKTLYIIHNLITYTSKEQIENYINNILLKNATFDLIKRDPINTKIKSEEEPPYFHEKDKDIFHLIYANENSEAGNFYNKFTLDFIDNSYQNVIDIEPFDVIQRLKERFIYASKELIEKDDYYSFISENDILDNETILKEKKFKLKKNNRDIILKRCYIDELGFSNLRNYGFNPLYNYYIKGNKIIIRVEAPGNTNLTTDIKYSESFIVIEIQGKKRKDNEPKYLEGNLFNSREFGEFLIDIPLNAKDLNLKNKSPEIIKKQGIIMIEYEFYKLNENKTQNAIYICKEEV